MYYTCAYKFSNYFKCIKKTYNLSSSIRGKDGYVELTQASVTHVAPVKT